MAKIKARTRIGIGVLTGAITLAGILGIGPCSVSHNDIESCAKPASIEASNETAPEQTPISYDQPKQEPASGAAVFILAVYNSIKSTQYDLENAADEILKSRDKCESIVGKFAKEKDADNSSEDSSAEKDKKSQLNQREKAERFEEEEKKISEKIRESLERNCNSMLNARKDKDYISSYAALKKEYTRISSENQDEKLTKRIIERLLAGNLLYYGNCFKSAGYESASADIAELEALNDLAQEDKDSSSQLKRILLNVFVRHINGFYLGRADAGTTAKILQSTRRVLDAGEKDVELLNFTKDRENRKKEYLDYFDMAVKYDLAGEVHELAALYGYEHGEFSDNPDMYKKYMDLLDIAAATMENRREFGLAAKLYGLNGNKEKRFSALMQSTGEYALSHKEDALFLALELGDREKLRAIVIKGLEFGVDGICNILYTVPDTSDDIDDATLNDMLNP